MSINNINVLIAASEAVPYAKSGGLADVVGALPKALGKNKIDARVIIPLYNKIEGLTKLADFSFWLSWRECGCSLYKLDNFYFIENDYYFNRGNLYGYFDDGERFAFFSKACINAIPHLDFEPDILHCNDWQTAMIPVYCHLQKDIQTPVKTVFTIHNIEYQGKFGSEIVEDVLGLSLSEAAVMEYDSDYNFMKGAIETCHALTTVSKTYAEEIKTPFYGRGLENVILKNQFKLTGILNGIDKSKYNPQKDMLLPARFSRKRKNGKTKVKEALCQKMEFTDHNLPVFGMVGRLVKHKGIGLIASYFDELMEKPLNFVLIGTGDLPYENYFKWKAYQYKGRAAFINAFSEDLSRLIYAGSDFFIMPSISEPCGLAQMIAMRYGTVPIVRKTGGLNDTVIDYDTKTKEGNGIQFIFAETYDLNKAISYALSLYENEEDWEILVDNAFSSDFSWANSAKEYSGLYKTLLGGK